MFDLDQDAGQVISGVTDLPDLQVSVGGIVKGERGGLPIFHLYILRGFLRQQMVRRRRPFDHGVVALQRQGKLDLTIVIGGENTHSGALGVYDLEQGAAQRQLRPCLQLKDL